MQSETSSFGPFFFCASIISQEAEGHAPTRQRLGAFGACYSDPSFQNFKPVKHHRQCGEVEAPAPALWPANHSSVKSELRSKLKSGIPRKMQNMFKSTINVICLNKRTPCETFKLLNGEVEAPAPALWLANHSSVKSELRYKLKSCLPRKMKNMFKSTINVIYLNKRTQCETFKLLKKI